MSKQQTKPGSGPKGTANRYEKFAKAYIANGQNATQAAIEAGYSPNGAGVTGSKLLKHPKIMPMITSMSARILDKMELSAERTLREIARIAYSDTRKLYNADGTLKHMSEWDDDTAAAVASLETVELPDGQGRAHKIKAWDKIGALDKAMKYHDLYRPEPPVKEIEPTNDLEIARRIWFILDAPLRKSTQERIEAPSEDG